MSRQELSPVLLVWAASALASFPGLPRFCSSVCVQHNSWKWNGSGKVAKNGNTNHMNDVRWTQGGRRRVVPNYKTCVINLREFLTSQAKYSRSCEHLGSCLVTQCSMMKSNMLFHVFECRPLSPYVHFASTWHHSRVPRPSLFSAALLSCIILNINWRTKMGEAWERGYKYSTLSFDNHSTSVGGLISDCRRLLFSTFACDIKHAFIYVVPTQKAKCSTTQ